MNRKWIEYFLLWSRRKDFHQKIMESKNFIEKLGDEKIYVAYSGGKDSIVLLHIAYQVLDGKLDVWHWDHGKYLMPREIEKEIIHNLYIIAPKSRKIICSSPKLNNIEARWNYTIWYHTFFPTLYKMIKKYGWKIGLLGLRCEESITRRIKASKKCIKDKHNVKICFPLYNWKWQDIWAYIIKNKLPYPSIYDKYGEKIGYNKARLVTFFDNEFSHLGNQIDKYIMWRYKNL